MNRDKLTASRAARRTAKKAAPKAAPKAKAAKAPREII